MVSSLSTPSSQRINFGLLQEVIAPPDLIHSQVVSYTDFLQKDVPASQRKPFGLQGVFKEVFPIKSYDGRYALDFVSYHLVGPKKTDIECLHDGSTYSVGLYVKLRLEEGDFVKEEEIYMGEIPMITAQGSFIINGAERVVVSQLHRSPGICFEETPYSNGQVLQAFRIIPDRGTWIEVQFDPNGLLYVYLDRRRRRRKFLITTLLRAMGHSTDIDILSLFYTIQTVNVKALNTREESLAHFVLIEDIVDAEKGAVLARAFESLTSTMLRAFAASGIEKVRIIDTSQDEGTLIRCLKKDGTRNEDEALKDIYKRLRPGEPATASNAKALLKRLFGDPKRYDLGRVGRYKINQKLDLKTPVDHRVVDVEDIVAATRYLCRLRRGDGVIDDIDDLSSRRVRTVGELVTNQCRTALARTERLVKERMTLYDQSVDAIAPQRLINPKVISTAVRDFFSRSQLSQLMDQVNPLSELTHKRRISALGPGGLNRDRAGFDVRDVHHSHFGRICPIETPEGANIGLINSLSLYSHINEFGFIETPYQVVKKGKVTQEIVYLTADREENAYIAQANSQLDAKGNLLGKVTVRQRDRVLEVDPEQVHYIDVSPKQLVSAAAGLIPFLKHDDANRALMGSNMQRQGVPLLQAESPYVGTGIEAQLARDSKAIVVAQAPGVVASVDARHIVITPDGKLPARWSLADSPQTDTKKGIHVYRLRKFMRSNAATCFNQKPVVRKGQAVQAGDVLADGPSTQQGELALGRNVLVAFMPWNGYNFEDAILISNRLIKDDVFTSLHIDEFEVTARDTKLGPEEITRDIPNVGDEALKNLDRNGVIRVGAEVKPGDILVGKITPKSDTDLPPEEKLLRAIFGEKAADIKDTSLVAPSGCYGIVASVKVSSRADADAGGLSAADVRRQVRKINEDFKVEMDKIREDLTEAISNILLGEKIPLDVVNAETGEVIIAANRKITKTLLRKMAGAYKTIQIEPSPVRIKIMDIIDGYRRRFEEVEAERDRRVGAIESGDSDEGSVIKNVKVYVATKRKIQVGDKMAGRHGNKGVVAKIVAEADMPFLPDGTPIDIVLNPLGVPSRMNVGQVLETHLGWACSKLGLKVATPVFDDISEAQVRDYLKQADLPVSGKTVLYDGQSGEAFEQEVVVGQIYMLKLNHLVANKIHARAVGPYSLITQQPLGGKAQYGGQRFGEMEVWALEAYGAAYTLQELLTVKSDDVQGRTRTYEGLVKGNRSLEAGTPQSFSVLVKEMQGLGLNVTLEADGVLFTGSIGGNTQRQMSAV
jgi:DNA-directed RNA polymerase subunit beta